jgi:glucans biosynthesis protein
VHDSEGLQVLTGGGEWIWRPLSNPADLQISAFVDRQPRGFGLMQRSRSYDDYLDAEARYEHRPSLWIEPVGNWGEGWVELVEIPTDKEFNDNIVAYWTPTTSPAAGSRMSVGYRMRWTNDILPSPEMLHVAASYAGRNLGGKRLLFVVDFASSGEPANIAADGLTPEASASDGKIYNAIVHESHPRDALRVSFELDPSGASLSELRLRLLRDGKPASESWAFRWTNS